MDYNYRQEWLGALAICRNVLSKAGEQVNDNNVSQADDTLDRAIKIIAELRIALVTDQGRCQEIGDNKGLAGL